LRAGRFDRRVTVAPPDGHGRAQLLGLYTRDHRLAGDVSLAGLARRMPGLTGADIANVVNQAALQAARDRRRQLSAGDFDEALATVMLGRARRSAVVTPRDREVTAWHEAGHAVAALVLPDAQDPVVVTVVPRGSAGGGTWMGGVDDSFQTRTEAQAQLAVSLAGRAAEELLLDGDFTQGASGDLLSATQLATRMVTIWGMSSLGLSAVDPGGTALPERVQTEVDDLLAEALDTARRSLATHQALLNAVVNELLSDETVHLGRLRALERAFEEPSAAA
jgi:cell division protease FtsH